MKKLPIVMLLLVQTTLSAPVWAREAPQPLPLKVKLGGGIKDKTPIPARFAFCMQNGKDATKDGGNLNPQISWSGAPKDTKSFAIVVVDKDVPASFDNANKPGKVIAKDAPRQNFYHWVMADIPADVKKIPQGKDSGGIVVGGKPVGKTKYGVNGRNDYATFMKGTYGGYDGPCPPWNDERLHHYHFQVYALDVSSLGLKGAFTGKDLEKAMEGRVLAKGEVVGTYTNNKDGVKP
jgi:Raf kinase inhibitor-like YbhB/YbcL family protein